MTTIKYYFRRRRERDQDILLLINSTVELHQNTGNRMIFWFGINLRSRLKIEFEVVPWERKDLLQK